MLEVLKSKERKKLEGSVDSLERQVENYAHIFDGEKTQDTLGAAKDLYLDYYTSGLRAWELKMTNDIYNLLTDKLKFWVIGKGLRFDATPDKMALPEKERQPFIDQVEYRFRNYAKSRYIDYHEQNNLNKLALDCFENALIGGDCLVILRVKNKRISIQLIDGILVDGVARGYKLPKQNTILDGVELDSKGRQIAYHVTSMVDGMEIVKRIPAYDSRTGLRYSFMVYGSSTRIGEVRGEPYLLQDFERLTSLDRYNEAVVKQAEITSKIVYTVEHDNSSTGADPFASMKGRANTTEVEQTDTGNAACGKINKTTGATALNLEVGSTLKATKPQAEQMYPNFAEAVFQIISANGKLPAEVALSKYGSNYSASRAAIKDFEYNIKVLRESFVRQFYKPIYEFFLFNEVSNGNVKLDTLVSSYLNKDIVTIEALTSCKFTGVNVPSIDPLKEVKAIRSALGDETTPLTTYAEATEIISNGDFTETQEQVKRERTIAIKPEKNEGTTND